MMCTCISFIRNIRRAHDHCNQAFMRNYNPSSINLVFNCTKLKSKCKHIYNVFCISCQVQPCKNKCILQYIWREISISECFLNKLAVSCSNSSLHLELLGNKGTVGGTWWVYFSVQDLISKTILNRHRHFMESIRSVNRNYATKYLPSHKCSVYNLKFLLLFLLVWQWNSDLIFLF